MPLSIRRAGIVRSICADEGYAGVWRIYFVTTMIATRDERNYIIKEWLAECHPCCWTKGYPCTRAARWGISRQCRKNHRAHARCR